MLVAKADYFMTIMSTEFKAQIADYLKTLGPQYPKTLDDLARLANDPASGYPDPHKAFGLKYNASTALAIDDPLYLTARDQGMALTKAAVDAVMKKFGLDAIVYLSSPTAATPIVAPPDARATRSPLNRSSLGYNISNLAGYPDIVVPAGMTPAGLPVTISFMGPAFSDGPLLGYAYDFEQATHARRLPKFTPVLSTDKVGH